MKVGEVAAVHRALLLNHLDPEGCQATRLDVGILAVAGCEGVCLHVEPEMVPQRAVDPLKSRVHAALKRRGDVASGFGGPI